MDAWDKFLLCALTPIAVYGLARIIFTAYFRAKAHYMRSIFRGDIDQTERHDG